MHLFALAPVCGLALLCLSAAGAAAFVVAPRAGAATDGILLPVAMCGRSCAGGGHYVPGPPTACLERGLNVCSPSRGPAPRAVVPAPGGQAVGAPAFVGPARRETCRTVTVQRPDGSMRRARECH